LDPIKPEFLVLQGTPKGDSRAIQPAAKFGPQFTDGDNGGPLGSLTEDFVHLYTPCVTKNYGPSRASFRPETAETRRRTGRPSASHVCHHGRRGWRDRRIGLSADKKRLFYPVKLPTRRAAKLDRLTPYVSGSRTVISQDRISKSPAMIARVEVLPAGSEVAKLLSNLGVKFRL
jgi:hypothetical protein